MTVTDRDADPGAAPGGDELLTASGRTLSAYLCEQYSAVLTADELMLAEQIARNAEPGMYHDQPSIDLVRRGTWAVATMRTDRTGDVQRVSDTQFWAGQARRASDARTRRWANDMGTAVATAHVCKQTTVEPGAGTDALAG